MNQQRFIQGYFDFLQKFLKHAVVNKSDIKNHTKEKIT